MQMQEDPNVAFDPFSDVEEKRVLFATLDSFRYVHV